jgi:ABC-type uncharacterized transport system permease subunit
MPDSRLLHEFMLCLKGIERFSGVAAEVEFLKQFGLLGFVLLLLDDLLELVCDATIFGELRPDAFGLRANSLAFLIPDQIAEAVARSVIGSITEFGLTD